MSENLHKWIHEKTSFITDIEKIVDVIYEAKQVYLYDTSAISSHELSFNRHQDHTFLQYINNSPVLITGTIAAELRMTEDKGHRYVDYFSHFNHVLYVQEEKLLDMLKLDYELMSAKSKFLIASERAFLSIQYLREQVQEAKINFSKAEQKVLSVYQSFFAEKNNMNKGEISLLWASSMIEQLPGRTHACFVGLDHDLYDFVERSFFSRKNSPFSNDITFLSNDSLLQSYYRTDRNQDALAQLIPMFRNQNRTTRFYRKINGLFNQNQQKEKISNEEFLRLLTHEEIEVVY